MKKFVLIATTAFTLSVHAQTHTTVSLYSKSYYGSPPANIFASLDVPEGTGKFPSVVLMHGCNGINNGVRTAASILNRHGYATLIIDSFSGRGVSSVCDNPARVGDGERMMDVYAGADLMRSQPWSNGKVGAVGFSHGAITMLVAGQKQSPSEAGSKPFDVLIAFYPMCYPFAHNKIDTPILIMVGGKDTWTPAITCRDLVTYTPSPQKELIELVEYPDSVHAFDLDGGWTQMRSVSFNGDMQLHMVGGDPFAREDSHKRMVAKFDTYLK